MLNIIKKWKKTQTHLFAIHTFNHALCMGSGTDWNANDVIKRLVVFGEFDIKHHQSLPLNDHQVKYLTVLARSSGSPAKRTAEMILRTYVDIFKRSYDIRPSTTGVNSLAYHYLTDLDIDLMPVSNMDKFALTLANNLL